jgi:hypothetical protein
MERPELRTFECDPVEVAKAKRPQLVAAALAILRAYHVGGRPAHGLTPLGSFEAWSSLVRGALVWLEVGDPADSMGSIRARDPQREMLRAVLTAWRAAAREPLTTSEAINRAEVSRNFRPIDPSSGRVRVDPNLFDALHAVAGQGRDAARQMAWPEQGSYPRRASNCSGWRAARLRALERRGRSRGQRPRGGRVTLVTFVTLFSLLRGKCQRMTFYKKWSKLTHESNQSH